VQRDGTGGNNEGRGDNASCKLGGSDNSDQSQKTARTSENGSDNFLGEGTNLQGVFSSPYGSKTDGNPFTSKTALKQTPIPVIAIILPSAEGASVFMAESEQMDTLTGKVAKGTPIGTVGKLSQGQKNRKRKKKKKERERELTALKSRSGPNHLVDQVELSEGTHGSLSNFKGTQDQVTPPKPLPHVGDGCS
jgi:hypothetical protein